MNNSFTVLKAGLISTVQALGRHGYFDRGIPPSGAMDPFALKLGNLILGNDLDEAGIEMNILGMEMAFDCETVIAITGGKCEVRINEKLVPMWKAVKVNPGDTLSIGLVEKGCRSYLCIAGGIDVPVVLGSKSTYLQGKLGGFKGRVLQPNDRLNLGKPKYSLDEIVGRTLKSEFIPSYEDEITELRVIWGPQDDLLTDESKEDFVNKVWNMSPDSNRVGCRFTGVKLNFKEREKSPDQGDDLSNIVDDGISVGSIQVPSGEVAICMGADVVNAGGFVKPACLISADQSRLAQLKPGSKVRFKAVEDKEAVEILKEQEQILVEKNIVKENV